MLPWQNAFLISLKDVYLPGPKTRHGTADHLPGMGCFVVPGEVILFYCRSSNFCVCHVSDKDLELSLRVVSLLGLLGSPPPLGSAQSLKSVKSTEAAEMQLCYPSS